VLSVGVEAGVGLFFVPRRVRYTFGRPHPGYFVRSDLVGTVARRVLGMARSSRQ
jgi:hypothetical protein